MNVFLLFDISFIMKKTIFSILLLLFCLGLLFVKNTIIQESIISASQLFFYKVFPSLFPMMILSDLFFYFHVPEVISHFLGPLFSRFFHMSFQGCYLFLLSCISGSPANVYAMKNLVLENQLSMEEACYLVSFSFFQSPLFLYSAISSFAPNSHVFYLMLIPYVSNLILGFFTRPVFSFQNIKKSPTYQEFGLFFSNSLKNVMNTLTFVLGSMVFFFLVNSLINPKNVAFLKGILEISQGLYALRSFENSLFVKELLAMIFVSFGGLSIHMQVKGILSEAGIPYLPFLKGRIYEIIVSITLFLMFHYAFFLKM